MLFVSAAHSFLRLIIALLLLKNVAIGSASKVERRSLFFDGLTSQPGIQYAATANPIISRIINVPSPALPTSTASLSLTPAVFSHHVYHDYHHQYQQTRPQKTIAASLGTGSLIPIVYGSTGGGSSFYGNKYLPPPPPTHLSNHLSHGIGGVEEDVAEPYYYHGDRILKQYLVAEKAHQHELQLLNQHLGNPFQPAMILRYETRQLPFGGIVDVPVFDSNDLEQKLHPFKPSSLRKNHGPIALGSGSLGLITLPNGNVYLGSGSLGYVSEKQHVETLVRATPRPLLQGSPVHFGTNQN